MPLSFRLHADLAKEHDGASRWGYRTVHCGSISANGNTQITPPTNAQAVIDEQEWKKLPKTNKKRSSVTAEIPANLDWLDKESMISYSEMGTPETTAQVHPFLFTTSIAELAAEKGAKITLGSVTGIDYQSAEGVKSVTYEDTATKEVHTIPATDVVLSAGPWTKTVFPEAPISAMRAHSVVIRADVSPYAIFTSIKLPPNYAATRPGNKRRHGKSVNPEMYARPDGTVYACGKYFEFPLCFNPPTDNNVGEGDTLIPLPRSSDLVVCDDSACDDIYDYLSLISKPLQHGEVVAKQACYLPLVDSPVDRGPIIGKTGVRGMLIAAGHTCWGIQNSCATGKLMSEFVFDGKAKSANIDSLDPKHVMDVGQ